MKTFRTIIIAIISVGIVGVGAFVGAAWYFLDANKIRGIIISQVEKETGRTLTINGEVAPSFGFTPTLAFHDITLSNPEWAKQEYFARADKLAVSFKLIPLFSSDFRITALSMDGATVYLEQSGKKANWDLVDGSSEEEQEEALEETLENISDESSNFQLKAVKVTNSALHYNDLKTKDAYSVAIDTLDIASISDGKVNDATLSGQYNGAAIEASANLDGDVLQIVAALDRTGVAFDADGAISTKDGAFDGKVNAKADNMAQLLELFGEKSDDKTPVKLSATLGGTTDIMTLNDVDASYGDYDVKGNGKINLTKKTPYLQGKFSIPTLDLTKEEAKALAEHADEAIPNAEKKRVIPTSPLPLDSLSAINGDLELSIGKLVLDDITFSKVSTDLKLNKRVLEVNNLKASAGDGNIAGKASLSAANDPANLTAELNAQNMTLGGLMAEFAGDTTIDGGKLTSTLTLNGNGNDLHSIMAGANGNYDVYIEQATYTPPEGVQKASAFFDLLRGGSGSGPVTIQCAIADFDITDGVANSKAIAIKSPSAVVTGDGNVNMRKETLRIALNARSTALGMADVVPPLVIAGNWQNPSVTLDAAKSLFNIGKFAIGALTGVGLVAVIGEQFTDKLGITADNNPCLQSIAEAHDKAAEADANPDEAFKDAEDNVRELRDDIKGNLKGVKKDAKELRDGLKGLIKKD